MRTLLRVGWRSWLAVASALTAENPPAEKKPGVLLANHGSRSATWRNSLLALENRVRPTLLAHQAIPGVQTALMAYTEPSIATRLKEFDADGFTDLILVPLFLTVCPHPFDEIPTNIGKQVDPQSRVAGSLPKLHAFPTPDQVKIYYDNASLPVDFVARTGTYERVQRRPLLSQTHVRHRNRRKGALVNRPGHGVRHGARRKPPSIIGKPPQAAIHWMGDADPP